MALPDVTEGPVAVRVLIGRRDLREALAEAGVEEDLPALRELREARDGAPTDEHVAVREELRIALERRQQLLRMAVAADERHLLRLRVHLEHEDPRELLERRRRAVVEQRDRPVALAAGVVLPLEVRPVAHLEAALLAADLPQDLLRLPVDLVDRVRVARGDEEVAVRLRGDRIQVDVVVRRRLRALLRARD